MLCSLSPRARARGLGGRGRAPPTPRFLADARNDNGGPMNQRLVYIAGSVIAAALILFAVWHARQPKPAPAAAAQTSPAPATEDPNAAAPRIESDLLYAH